MTTAAAEPNTHTALPDNTSNDPTVRPPLVLGDHTMASITDVIDRVVEVPLAKTSKGWLGIFAVSNLVLVMLLCNILWLLYFGVGVWGVNNPVGWGFAIVNLVFWVGIGHAGTLISAILFLFRQKWRTGINRFSEAMTIFAVICALLFPGIHVGRAWVAYWMIPIPNQMTMWPNFRSPLLWDLFAFSTYFTISLLFWYMGMVPDLAGIRDRARKAGDKVRTFAYGLLSLGWRGSNRHWQHYERAYLILAALATPLVLSVHSVVSFDFAVSQLPGWHTTIFPPYFVAGAIFSGFAMVLTLIIPAREWYGLKTLITQRHIDNMCKIILVTGSIVGYAYITEYFIAWYSGVAAERFTFINRSLGPYWWAYWIMFSCNVFVPQIFWFKKMRSNIAVVFVVSIFVNIGMWFERFVIVVTSLHRDWVPAAWGYYTPTAVDIMTLIGSFGLFMTLFMLFLRFLPQIAIAEVKAVAMDEAERREHPYGVSPVVALHAAGKGPELTPKEVKKGKTGTLPTAAAGAAFAAATPPAAEATKPAEVATPAADPPKADGDPGGGGGESASKPEGETASGDAEKKEGE
ncbi:MAG: NrfD/PsrC family molybdoenzyme membrane anchor subunit [Planctomycetota bacterium]